MRTLESAPEDFRELDATESTKVFWQQINLGLWVCDHHACMCQRALRRSLLMTSSGTQRGCRSKQSQHQKHK